MSETIDAEDIADKVRAAMLVRCPGTRQFDGPFAAYCFGKPYVVHGTIGEDPETTLKAHIDQLGAVCESAVQIAWRRPTELVKDADFESDQVRWKITSRLAVFP